jgi:hypothetical protein
MRGLVLAWLALGAAFMIPSRAWGQGPHSAVPRRLYGLAPRPSAPAPGWPGPGYGYYGGAGPGTPWYGGPGPYGGWYGPGPYDGWYGPAGWW